jgi:hypothetical protein
MTRLLTRIYPRAWRERYGDELSDLIDATGLTPRIAMDVARGAAREWTNAARFALTGGVTMVIGPAWRHPTSWALVSLVVLAPTLTMVVLSLFAYQLGMTGLITFMEPVTRWLNSQRLLDALLVGAPAVAFLLAAAPLLRLELRMSDTGREAVLGVRLRAVNVVIGLVALVVGGLLIGHILFESVLQVGA